MIPTALQNDEIVSSGRSIPSVIDVEYLGEYRLYLEFDDGLCGEVDLSDYINRIPSMQDLKDPKNFIQFGLSDGTIGWFRNRDVSPRWLHDRVKKSPTN